MYVYVKQKKIEILPSIHFKERFLGLMGKKSIKNGMFFPKCNSIHTFFMREPITVLFTDNNNKIIKVIPSLKPWRIILPIKGSSQVYEFPNEFGNDFEINTILKIIEKVKTS